MPRPIIAKKNIIENENRNFIIPHLHVKKNLIMIAPYLNLLTIKKTYGLKNYEKRYSS